MPRKSRTVTALDQVRYWTEIKLDIVREYAKAYSTVLATRKKRSFYHVYIEGFAGAGLHTSRTSGEFVAGSPLNALLVFPPFRKYYFIDLDRKKVKALREIARDREDVRVYDGDFNDVLLSQVFPRVRYQDYRRGLCLLDPYGLHLDWKVVETAGRMRSIELFLSLPIGEIRRRMLRRGLAGAPRSQLERLDRYWGDASWQEIAYEDTETLFGFEKEKQASAALVREYRARLKDVAGFRYVPHPIPMRNTRGAVIYYLFFASNKRLDEKTVKDIFDRYRHRGS